MIEIYKMNNNLNPPIMDNTFERRNNTYNLRDFQELATKRKRTVKMDLQTLNYRSPQLWSILLENIRQINSLDQLGNGFALTARADYVNFACQTLGFCNIYLLVMYICNHPSLASLTTSFVCIFISFGNFLRINFFVNSI